MAAPLLSPIANRLALGVSPLEVTSRAIPISGSTEKAAVFAPLSPTSS